MHHPEFYYGRAEEARIIAQATIDPKARKTLIQRAAEYQEIQRAPEYQDLAKLATVQKK